MRHTTATYLQWLGIAWLVVGCGLILMGYVAVAVLFSLGFTQLIEVMDPFDIWNVIAAAVILAPGIGLLSLSKKPL